MSESVPFTEFRGFLKQVDAGSMTEVGRLALQFGYPHFSDEPTTPREAEIAARRVEKQLGHQIDREPAFRYRRFAGGPLPRGCYSALCMTDVDEQPQTLAREIVAYATPEHSKAVIWAREGSAHHSSPNSVTAWHGSSPRHVLSLAFDLRGNSHPFVELLRQQCDQPAKGRCAVLLPVRISHVRIDNVIDLRLPATQHWLYQSVTTGIPGVFYSYRDLDEETAKLIVGPPNDDLDWKRPTIPVTSDELYIYKPSRTWRGEVVNGAENFFGLLAFLMCPSPGGSPITEVLGRWFRQLGAQGLVFPSARNDAACLFEKGRLTGYEGWNFVDYRDAAAPALRHTMIQEPHSWGRNDIAVRYFKGSVRDGTWRTESISRQTIDTVEERLSTYQSKERRQMDIAKLAAQAQAAYDAGRFAEALKLATDLAKKRNNDYDVLLFLGNCHARLAQHREAVVAFHQASLVDRTASAPFSNSGNSLMALGDYGAAAASFQRALELDADDTAAQANLPIAEMLHNRSTSGGKVVHLSGKDLPED